MTKQFLSESLSTWDNIVFAMAPLGILTAVVSVIRVCGSSSLRAFIGRAQEGPGNAEIELLSCTSETTSELWNEGGIARVFGKPQILEIVLYHAPDENFNEDPNAGILTLKEAMKKNFWTQDGLISDPEYAKSDGFHSPNLSLNIGIKRSSKPILIGAALFGILLQTGKCKILPIISAPITD